jgi:hypothetical protein
VNLVSGGIVGTVVADAVIISTMIQCAVNQAWPRISLLSLIEHKI